MMPSDYALTKITNQNARELHERAACSRQAREIAAENDPDTPLLARMARLLKRQPAVQPTGSATLRVSPR